MVANGSKDRPAREDLDTALASFRQAWDGVVTSLAERIESGADLPDATSLAALLESSLPTVAAVESVLDQLQARISAFVDAPDARELRLRMDAVRSYAAGWIEGGGVAMAVLRDLPHPLTAEAVRLVLADQMGFVVRRTERAIDGWLPPRDGHDNATPASAPNADPALQRERFEQLLARATSLGVRIRNAPHTPSEGYLRKLALQLDDVARTREDQQRKAPARAKRLQDLLLQAERLKVRPRVVPPDPSDAWLDRMAQTLSDVAEKKGLSLVDTSPRLRVQDRPTPDQVTRIEAEGLETSEAPRPTVVAIGQQARLALLADRAESAGFDLGRIPANPSTDWLDDTEARLDAAIAQRREEMHAERTRREAERKVRLERIVSDAAEKGVTLGPVPTIPTDDWLERQEHRLATSQVATPQAGQAFLVFEEGTVQERIWLVEDGELTLGRGKDNIVQIRDDAGVSRRHATLQRLNGSFVIRDAGSTKGTLVDGESVKEILLAGGERITLGDTEFVFRVR